MNQQQKQNLRQPKNDFWGDDKPVAIAHRGGGAAYGKDRYRKENTLEVFGGAVNLGYKYLEMDVMSTADDKVVIVHVAKNKFDAMQAKKTAPDYQTLQKMTYKQMSETLGRKIPTLQEVFKKFPDSKFLIDVKTDKVVALLADVIMQSKAKVSVCAGSFYPSRIKKLHQILGDAVCYRINISRSPLHRWRQWQQLKKLSFISAVDYPYLVLSRRAVDKLHDKNLRVLVWVPNTEKQIKRSIDLGADGIISDSVVLLKQILRF